MEATEHDFASTQRLNRSVGAKGEKTRTELQHAWLPARLYTRPDNIWRLWMRLLRPRFSLALLTPILCGMLLGWWQGATFDLSLWALLLGGSAMTIYGLNLLHEFHDYWHARKHSEVHFNHAVFASAYHLMATEIIKGVTVRWTGYGLLLGGLICYLALVVQMGWPLMFFYLTSLLLVYTYTAPPVRYGYRGWALGELGLFLGYGFFPLLGGYYIVGQTLSWLPVIASIPFGLMAILLFANYNFIHHRRDWLMRKRTFVVTSGPARTLDLNSLLMLLIYASLLCLVSLAYLPTIALITLGALPLSIRIYGQLHKQELGLEESFRLYRATVTTTLWTTLLFAFALFVDKWF